MDVEKLKKLLGITGTDQDPLLDFIIEDVTETIQNYCNIKTIPSGLTNTAYRMAMDLYRGENFGSTSPDNGLVASQSAGDTSVSFRVNPDYSQSLLKDYREQLNRYRKISWT